MVDAVRTGVVTKIGGGSHASYRVLWEGLDQDDSGSPITLADFSDRSIQVIGNFSGSASLTIQGSNDGGTTWATLTDPLGNDLTFLAAGLKSILEASREIRPLVTTGDGSTDLDVHMFVTGGLPY